MAPAWLNPAGGLRYHVRAWVGGGRWAPFRSALAAWLAEFEPHTSRAVLVGPSAGYTFPDAFLSRFSAITVLEPDPIAGFLLERRLRRLGVAEVRLERKDQLIEPLLRDRAGLVELLRQDPEACLVFGNVLGQARFLVNDADFEHFKAAFRERLGPLLEQRAWLSFHDRLSGALAPACRPPHRATSRLADAAVLRELYSQPPSGQSVELIDHQSHGFFPGDLPHTYFDWAIDRERHHLIEAVMRSASG